jgi:hypothetical protein
MTGMSEINEISDRVKFNVGGRIFETTRSTILKYPDSVLAKHIGSMSQPDAEGHYFIDRNADVFAAILDYYRSGQLLCPTHVHPDIFAGELDFWGLYQPNESDVEERDVSAYQLTSFLQGLTIEPMRDLLGGKWGVVNMLLMINRSLCHAHDNKVKAIVIGLPYFEKARVNYDDQIELDPEWINEIKTQYLDVLAKYFNFSHVHVTTLPVHWDNMGSFYLSPNETIQARVHDTPIWMFDDTDVYRVNDKWWVQAIIAFL